MDLVHLSFSDEDDELGRCIPYFVDLRGHRRQEEEVKVTEVDEEVEPSLEVTSCRRRRPARVLTYRPDPGT